MKKTQITIVVLILAIVIGICIGIYLSKDSEQSKTNEENRNSTLDQIKTKIKALEDRIKHEIAMLKLTNEMENGLSKKVDRICLFIGAIFLSIMVLIIIALYISGLDLLTAVLSTAGLISLLCPVLSVVIWKTVDFNSVVEGTRKRIKIWLNKKYGHNPEVITTLSEGIKMKQQELAALVASTTTI